MEGGIPLRRLGKGVARNRAGGGSLNLSWIFDQIRLRPLHAVGRSVEGIALTSVVLPLQWLEVTQCIASTFGNGDDVINLPPILTIFSVFFPLNPCAAFISAIFVWGVSIYYAPLFPYCLNLGRLKFVTLVIGVTFSVICHDRPSHRSTISMMGAYIKISTLLAPQMKTPAYVQHEG